MTRALALALGLGLATGCEIMVGSGDLATEDRQVGAFSGLALLSQVDATVTLAAADPSVELVCDDNLLQHIEVAVDTNGVLVVEVANGTLLDPQGECQALVSADELRSYELTSSGSVTTRGAARGVEEIESSGSGSLVIEEIDTFELLVDHLGSGDIQLDGTATRLDILQDGSGRLDAEGLTAEEVYIEHNGSGSIVVTATDTAEVTLTGTGTTTVYGDPGNTTYTDNGPGDIQAE